MLLNHGTEMFDAIGPLLHLGERSPQAVVGEQRHVVFGQQLKQEGDSLSRPTLGNVKFCLPQHDDRIVGP